MCDLHQGIGVTSTHPSDPLLLHGVQPPSNELGSAALAQAEEENPLSLLWQWLHKPWEMTWVLSCGWCTALLNLELRGFWTLASAHVPCLTTSYLCLSISVMSHNTHITLLTNLGQFQSCHTPCTSSTSELISPWSTAITASHRLLRFPEFSSVLKLGYHQYHPQYHCLKFSHSSSSCSYSCFCSCPVFQHSIPVFRSVFQYFPIPNGYALWLIYIDPHLVQY